MLKLKYGFINYEERKFGDYMKTFRFNQNVSFVLHDEFEELVETKDGNDMYYLATGKSVGENGETNYTRKYLISERDFSDELGENDLFTAAEEFYKHKGWLKLNSQPDSVLFSNGFMMSLFTSVIKISIISALVKETNNKIVSITYSVSLKKEDKYTDPSQYIEIIELVKSMYVNGEKVMLNDLDIEQIKAALNVDFEVDDGFEINGYKVDIVEPDEEQYQHYKHILEVQESLSVPGIVANVNTAGAEMEFYSLQYMIDNTDDDNTKELYRRIINADSNDYELHKTAESMIELFRVNDSIYNPRGDREGELRNHYIKKSYMYNALRSFAWTMSDYCEKSSSTPDTLDYETVSSIAKIVEECKCLNYKDSMHMPGLCTGGDLHVFFVPAEITSTDKKLLEPTQEDKDDAERMKQTFPNYHMIFDEVHSLDDLRDDLNYIYPAVKIIYDELSKNRDRNEELSGIEADIVYSWIALALAAKEPFYTEDGPMNYDFGNRNLNLHKTDMNTNQTMCVKSDYLNEDNPERFMNYLSLLEDLEIKKEIIQKLLKQEPADKAIKNLNEERMKINRTIQTIEESGKVKEPSEPEEPKRPELKALPEKSIIYYIALLLMFVYDFLMCVFLISVTKSMIKVIYFLGMLLGLAGTFSFAPVIRVYIKDKKYNDNVLEKYDFDLKKYKELKSQYEDEQKKYENNCRKIFQETIKYRKQVNILDEKEKNIHKFNKLILSNLKEILSDIDLLRISLYDLFEINYNDRNINFAIRLNVAEKIYKSKNYNELVSKDIDDKVKEEIENTLNVIQSNNRNVINEIVNEENDYFLNRISDSSELHHLNKLKNLLDESITIKNNVKSYLSK
ncbi:hypothetical protein SAMN04487759_1064 [Kandleria vitulina]|uniref:Uncharacterized protein n=2 Tax=Kandleria vitulina TaxID=1630 RepID=A0A1H2RJ13_9FIRM|nr:hypothetical protein SAMN04487759_1064 [Kandleria vitulina]